MPVTPGLDQRIYACPLTALSISAISTIVGPRIPIRMLRGIVLMGAFTELRASQVIAIRFLIYVLARQLNWLSCCGIRMPGTPRVQELSWPVGKILLQFHCCGVG